MDCSIIATVCYIEIQSLSLHEGLVVICDLAFVKLYFALRRVGRSCGYGLYIPSKHIHIYSVSVQVSYV